MNTYDWTKVFRSLYEKAMKEYQAGNRDALHYFNGEELDFLTGIGGRPIELYDFAEDSSELDWDTALLITAARRDYFLYVQKCVLPSKRLDESDFPAKDAELQGIPWLPRIILKARARLRGEMPEDLMYCCGGDRKFLKQHNIHPADFLRYVWYAGNDDEKITDFVKQSGK